MSNRKYEDVKGYWVYSIYIPSVNKYYIGISGAKKCSQRWNKTKYKSGSLNQYLDEWENMKKTVLVDNLSSKEEALIMEDNIIRGLKMSNLCINELRSGLITNDKNTYQRELRKINPEYRKRHNQYNKQYQENNKEKIQEYNKQYYENNKEHRKQQAKQYYEDNKEKIKENRRKKKLENK